MFDELNYDERKHNSEKYFKTQIYFVHYSTIKINVSLV